MIRKGFFQMLPITTGVIPFGLVMGAVASNSGLNVFETMGFNLLVFAGASQLATLDLMNHDASVWVVIATGLIINLRHIMYSTIMAPQVQALKPIKKLGFGYMLTDQVFAVSSQAFSNIPNFKDKMYFYVGTAGIMAFAWHASTLVGFIFGNFIPKSWSMDFALPLMFMALVLPTLKNRILILVAIISATVSILAYQMPYHLGLIVAALTSVTVGVCVKQKIEKKTHG